MAYVPPGGIIVPQGAYVQQPGVIMQSPSGVLVQPQPQYLVQQPQFASTYTYGAPQVVYQPGQPQYAYAAGPPGVYGAPGPQYIPTVTVLSPEQAAVKIQAVYRGHTQRKELEEAAAKAAAEKKAADDAKAAPPPKHPIDPHGGTLKIQVLQADDLTNTQCCLRQDPFVRIRIGNAEACTEVHSSGHVNPRWNGQPFYLDLSKRDSSNKINVEIVNKNVFCDDLIGTVSVDVKELLAEFEKDNAEKSKDYAVQTSRAGFCGQLKVRVRYIPPLIIKVLEANRLHDTQVVGKQDPYVKLHYRGRLALGEDNRRRSMVHNDGDKHAIWNETFKFALGSEIIFDPKKEEKEPELTLEVYNDNIVVDAAIAYISVPFSKLMEIKATGKPSIFPLHIGAASEGGKARGGEITIEVQ